MKYTRTILLPLTVILLFNFVILDQAAAPLKLPEQLAPGHTTLLLSPAIQNILSKASSTTSFYSASSSKFFVNHRSQKHRRSTLRRRRSGRSYINVSGMRVRSPIRSESAPRGATAQCRDGTYSFSRNRRGTCSHHGGVARWL